MKKYKFNQLVVRHMLKAGAVHGNMESMTETDCEEYVQKGCGIYMFSNVIPAKNYNSFINCMLDELQGDTPDVFIKSYWTRKRGLNTKTANLCFADLWRMYNRSGIPSYQGAARIAEVYGKTYDQNDKFANFIDLYGVPTYNSPSEVNSQLANDAVYNFKRLVKLGTRIRGVSCPSSQAMSGFTVNAKLRYGEFGIFIKQRLSRSIDARESLMSNFLASIAAFYEHVPSVDYVRTSSYTTGVPTAVDYNYVGEVIVTLKSPEDFKAVDNEPEIDIKAEEPEIEIVKDPVTKSSLEDAWHAMHTQRDIIEHELTVQREEIKALEASYHALDVRREKLTVAMNALMEVL